MIGCIVQARMGSTRLPGKVMLPLDDEYPLLFYVLKQLQSCKHLDKIVVATTNLKEDDIVANYVKNLGIDCFRGSPNDVLARYYECAKIFSFDIVVRITADCPLIDPQIVDKVVQVFTSKNFDYVSNVLPRTFPGGTDTEIFTFKALESAWKNTTLPSEREHVTPYFHNNKDIFKLGNLENNQDLSKFRYTVDAQDDLDLVRILVSRIKKRPILLDDIMKLFALYPELKEINKSHASNEGYLKSLKEDKEFLKARKSNS